MENESESTFKAPRHLGWVFAAGLLLAVLSAEFLLRQRNPFERLGPRGGVPVAVLYFEKSSGTAHGDSLAAALDTLVGPAMVGAAPDSVIPNAILAQCRASRGLPASGIIPPGDALGVAGQAGARRFVVGRVSSLGAELAVEARLIASANGHELVVVRDTVLGGVPADVVAESVAVRLARRAAF